MRELASKAFGLWRDIVGPYIPDMCRFTPSCSHYAAEAVSRKGILVGLALTAWRLARCNPFNKGGYDPVIPSAPPCRCDGADQPSGSSSRSTSSSL